MSTFKRRLWNFDAFNDNIAIIDDWHHQLTYKELDDEASTLAESVGRRCLVFSLCRNVIGSAIGYVAFVNNGIVPVHLNANLDEGLLSHLIETYRPRYLWVPCDIRQRFSNMRLAYSTYDYCLLETEFDDGYPLFEECGLLVTTSGSTGSPKFVRQSYKNLIVNARSISEYLKLDSSERPITTLPMNYVYGLSVINSHFLVGATILLTDTGIMQRDFWQFFKEMQATSFSGVPYTYEMLDKLRFYQMRLPSLRTMTQAGGKLTLGLHEKFSEYAAKHGKEFVVMYGAAEATSRMGYLPSEKALEKKGSMGIPIPGGKFYLVDRNGQRITEPHTTGELVYEGENVALGYAERGEDLARGDEWHGRLETGDMAQFDEDGYYYIVGRKKRFLKIYGNRINLDETDRLLKDRFGIDVVCSGFDDHMYVFLTDERFVRPVKQYLAETTKLNPKAFVVVTLSEIPMGESGKIRYKELEAYFQNDIC